MANDGAAEPWDQQSGEPDAAYARFLRYRNMGPGRSLDAAFAASLPAAKRHKPPPLSGQWIDDSARWKWVERTAKWDVHVLLTAGRDAAAAYMIALRAFAEKTLAVVLKVKPTDDFDQAMRAVDLLSKLITHEAVDEVLRQARMDSGEPR